MLVLTRKRQEQIRIGENITLTILRIKGNTVRVGIEAPRDVRVIRGELPTKSTECLAETTGNGELPQFEPVADESAFETRDSLDEPILDSGRLHQLVRRRRRTSVAVANAI